MPLPKVPFPTQGVLELPAGHAGDGSSKPRLAEPTAVILASDILRWLISKVGRFPKQVRFGLGARLEAAHFDVLEELVRAQYARYARGTVRFANEGLEHRFHRARAE